MNYGPYEDLLADVLANGQYKDDRTGTGTISTFGRQLRYDLSKGFPLITSKKVHFKSVVYELLWMLRGDTNVKYLNDHGVTIWDEWANSEGDLGRVYGAQWRCWNVEDGGSSWIDQIDRAVQTLRADPDSRRNIVSAWNVGEVDDMALPPCHFAHQLYVMDGRVSLQAFQRSADLLLGTPFNIAFYALLTHMYAQQADLEIGDLVWTGGDCHIYTNHVKQVREQLSRSPRPLPRLELNKRDSIFDYKYEDVQIVGYDPHPAIKAEVAV